jgi:hypothetical protein
MGVLAATPARVIARPLPPGRGNGSFPSMGEARWGCSLQTLHA